MPIPLPRDPDGYIDLDAFPDDEVDLHLAALAPVPALPEDTWDEIVGAAPHTDPETLGLEVNDLVGPVSIAEPDSGSAFESTASWDFDAHGEHHGLTSSDGDDDGGLDATDAFDPPSDQ